MGVPHMVPAFVILTCLVQAGAGEPSAPVKVLGAETCMTSGCHGGAGPGRGAYHIWKQYDPHFDAAATLSNGRSKAMARQLGIENAEQSATCTVCHSPTRMAADSGLVTAADGRPVDAGVSCVNCHGPEEKWLLSHTRPDFPRGGLAKLGMRPLESAYERANNCVACHQNLTHELVRAKHPTLVFELDGLLAAEPRHWREKEGYSGARTWLVGQAVALREAAAQAKREPGGRRTAEIEAIRELLKATETGWGEASEDLVLSADAYAKRLSGMPMGAGQTRAVLARLIASRAVFQSGSFPAVDHEFRFSAIGCYAERLALAIDRLNESLVATEKQPAVAQDSLRALFDAALPPETFDAATADEFVRKLDELAKSQPQAEPKR